MSRHWCWLLLSLLAMTTASAQSGRVAAGDTLRVAYLATNPAQAVTDPKTGVRRGVAIDLATELARRQGVKLALVASPNPQAVMDAVQGGTADIGFVAYNPERAGPVAFSKPYLLVQQTFVVREDSSIRSVKDIDRSGQKIGARSGDSIALYLGRTLKQAELVGLSEAETGDAPARLRAGTLHAFGANRQRLTDIVRGAAGVRLLPDDLYGVEQAIVVPPANAEALNAVNQFIDDVRRSGFLQNAIERSSVVGIAVAPER